MSHEKHLAKARKHNLCLNCLRQGHYSIQCKSTRRCEECGGKHHFLLHSEKGKGEEDKGASETRKTREEERVANYNTNGRNKRVLLMMCQVVIQGPEGSATQARALLDLGSETSFITERLAQQLRLPRCRQGPVVICIGGSTRQIHTKGFVSIKITDMSLAGKAHSVEATVLPMIN